MSLLIEDRFSLYKNNLLKYDVKLSLESLSYTSNSSKVENSITHTLSIRDIIGCALMKSNKSEEKNKVYLTIYSYPMVNNRKKRRRKTITFEVFSKNTFEENLQVANNWRKLLYHVLYWYNEKDNEETSIPLFKFHKKFLIFVNPKSGPGIALEIFEKKVKPILSEAEVAYDVVITDHANHAYELVQHKDLHIYSGIVIIAGDGLIYEVYNGLLQRADSNAALTIPIGVIPGGSGNGLASSIARTLNEPYLSNPALVSTLNIVNPVITPLDLALLQTHRGHRLVSFLSVGYGIIADIDIDSERLRRLGEIRFVIYGVARIFYVRKYRARLSYKVAEDVLANSSSLTKRQRPLLHRSQTVHEEGVGSYEKEQNVKDGLPSRPKSLILDEDHEAITPTTELARDPFLENINNANTLPKEEGRPIKIPTAWDWPIYSDEEIRLDDPVPSDWITVEDDFVSIYAVNAPYIGSESNISPKSAIDDGVMWLCYLRGNVSKTLLTKFMISLDSGTHVGLPGVTYVPVTDFRLVPLCSEGKLTVDGERIELGPIQATVLPRKGRLMVRRS